MQLAAEQAAGVRLPAQIGEYSEHALNQIAGRDGGIGVNKSALLNAWTNPRKIEYVPSKYGPTFRLTGTDVVIVVNADERLSPAGQNHLQEQGDEQHSDESAI